jgi:hypothetical protein
LWNAAATKTNIYAAINLLVASLGNLEVALKFEEQDALQ